MELNQGWTHNAMLLLLHTILPAMFQTCIQTLKLKGQVAEHKPQVLLIKKNSRAQNNVIIIPSHFFLQKAALIFFHSNSNVQILKSYVIS